MKLSKCIWPNTFDALSLFFVTEFRPLWVLGPVATRVADDARVADLIIEKIVDMPVNPKVGAAVLDEPGKVGGEGRRQRM